MFYYVSIRITKWTMLIPVKDALKMVSETLQIYIHADNLKSRSV